MSSFSPPPGAQLVPDYLIQASLRRRAAPAARTLGSRVVSASLPVGKRWHVGMLPHLPPCLSGFVTGALFEEGQTTLLKLWPMRSGTAAEFGEVLDRHAVWVLAVHPDVGSLEIRGDSESAWTAHQRGDDQLPWALFERFRRTGRSFVIHRSPGGTQALKKAGTARGQFCYSMGANFRFGLLSLRAWSDMGLGAVAQVNARPVWRPGTRTGDAPPPGVHTTRKGAYYKVPEDLSVQIAGPGQALWTHLDSVAASQATERADAGYFTMPLDGGILVRNLRTLKTCVSLHVSVVADPPVRLPQLLLSDAVLRTHGRLTDRASVVQVATRSLCVKSPLSPLADPRLVLLDPLPTSPVRSSLP